MSPFKEPSNIRSHRIKNTRFTFPDVYLYKDFIWHSQKIDHWSTVGTPVRPATICTRFRMHITKSISKYISKRCDWLLFFLLSQPPSLLHKSC